MRKLYFAFLLCIVSVQAMAQSGTIVLYATGSAGSWTTGSSTNTVATEGTMAVSSGAIVDRAFAKFDLSTLPADAVITSVTFGVNAETYIPLGPGMGTATTFGYAGDLGAFSGTPGTLFSSMVAPASTSLSTTSYGPSTGNKKIALNAAASTLVQTNIGGVICISITTTQPRAYTFTGESGIMDTTGTHAPYILIKYTCASISGISAVASPSTVCAGSSVALTGAATGAGAYLWTGPTGVLSATNTATASPTASSSYTLSITSATTGCTVDSTINVTVNPSPSAIVSASGPTAMCIGSTVDLFASSPPPGATFQWYDGSTAIAGATNGLYTASATGDYALQVTNTAGCSAISTGTPVLVLDVPTLTPSGAVNVCTAGGGSTVLTVNTGGVTSGLDYQWKKDGVAIPGATNSTYTATASGSYVAQVSTTGGGCVANSTATTVTISLFPNPPVNYNGSVVSTSNTFINYQWFLNSVAITGATSYNYIPTMNGGYRVKTTNTFGCVGYSNVLTIGNVGVAEVSMEHINIFPNPATNIVHIDAAYKVSVAVTSVDGRTLIDQKDATEINIAHLANGVYLIRVYDEHGQQLVVKKLVKE